MNEVLCVEGVRYCQNLDIIDEIDMLAATVAVRRCVRGVCSMDLSFLH